MIKNTKKALLKLILLFTTILLCGCKLRIETVEEHNNRLSSEQALTNNSIIEITDISATTQLVTDTKQETSTTTNNNNTTEGTAVALPTESDINASSTTDTKDTDSTTSLLSTEPDTTSNSEETTTAASDSKVPTETATTTTDYITVHLSITCKNILSEGPFFVDGKEITDGVLLSKSYSVAEGTNVFQVLLNACNANNIPIIYSGKYVYVRSINNLSEKQFGLSSGWMYKVNGNPPNMTCSSYKLSDGDVIEFYYVTSFK